MAQNVSNLYISESFQNIVFVSASAEGNVLATALGVPILSSSISASYAYSSSVAVQADSATSAISAITALSSSFAESSSVAITAQTASIVLGSITSASFADSASLAARNLLSQSNDFSQATFYRGDGTTFTVDYTPRRVVENVKNGEAGTLIKGTPVYVSGSTGNASIIYAASASRADRMPAAYVLDEQLTAGQEGTALLAGFINGIDTSAFLEGEVVYVDANGGYTNVRPTGSANYIQKLGNVIKVAVNGSGVVIGAGQANDLPNITSGYTWVGNADGVPTATPTSSFIIQPFPYTGSAGIQGDLNIDGPLTASAGIRIGEDTLTTGNKALKIGNVQDFDGAYVEFEADGEDQFRLLQSNTLNAIELKTSGSTQSKELRFFGAGGAVLTSFDSPINITTTSDDSIFINPLEGDTTGVSKFIINAKVSGSIPYISASAFVGDGSKLTNITAESASFAESASVAQTASLALGIQDGVNANFGTITATSASFTYLQSVTGSATIIGDAFVVLNNDTPVQRYAGMIVQDSGSLTTASFQYDGQTDDWFYEYSGSDPTNFGVTIFGPEYATKGSPAYPVANELQMGMGGHHITGSKVFSDGTTVTTDLAITASNLDAPIVSASNALVKNDINILNTLSINHPGPATGIQTIGTTLGGAYSFGVYNTAANLDLELLNSGSQKSRIVNYNSGIEVFCANDFKINTPLGKFYTLQGAQFDGTITANGTINAFAGVSGSFSGSFEGDGSALTGIVSVTSASFAESASIATTADSASVATFADSATSASYVGPTIEQNLTISGSVNGEVNTLSIVSDSASLDCSLGNFFTLTLQGGGNVHLTATNIQAGQTINLRLTQPSPYGTIDFEGGTFEFPGALPFTASAVDSAQDIISFVTFDGSTLYGTGIKNLG